MSYTPPAYTDAGGNLSGGYVAPVYTDAGGDLNAQSPTPSVRTGIVRTRTGATNIELRYDLDVLRDTVEVIYGPVPNIHNRCGRSQSGATNQELRDDMDDIISFVSDFVTISYITGVVVSDTRATNIEIRNDIDSVNQSI